jgi:hypothetical protein
MLWDGKSKGTRGWAVGDAASFLELSDEEMRFESRLNSRWLLVCGSGVRSPA